MHDYRLSHIDHSKSHEYDQKFSHNAHRSMMWEMERHLLTKIVNTLKSKYSNIRYLDFACGTGRILGHLEDIASESVGIDISPAMLSLARKRVTKSIVIEGDITSDSGLISKKFELITAFRFFPNAQPDLRDQVMRFLASHLSPSGYLVFNNHLNFDSSMLRLARVFGQYKDIGMRDEEVIDLTSYAGLRIVKRYHLGILPSNERYLFLPSRLVRVIENIAFRERMCQALSQNIIYVCEHA